METTSTHQGNPGARYGLEALSDEPSLGTMGSQKVFGIPLVLAIFFGHPGTMDGPSDRYGPLVYGPSPSPERGRQWGHLSLERWPGKFRHHDGGIRLRSTRR